MADKGHVSNTYADSFGRWHAEVEAANGNGEREVYGSTWQTIRNRAAKAIKAEIDLRQANPCPPVRVEFLGIRRRKDDSLFALFREK